MFLAMVMLAPKVQALNARSGRERWEEMPMDGRLRRTRPCTRREGNAAEWRKDRARRRGTGGRYDIDYRDDERAVG